MAGHRSSLRRAALLAGPRLIGTAAMVMPLVCAPQDVDVAEKPGIYPDDTFITINGTIDAIEQDRFVLDYGDGEIVVEMGGQSGESGTDRLEEGDSVSVYGIIDDGVLERRTVEAGGVYVERLDTTIRSSSVGDEEDSQPAYPRLSRPSEPFESVVTGRVTAIDPLEGEITLAAGDRDLEIELMPGTRTLLEDVTPDSQTIEVGDLIEATGRMDERFFGGPQMSADSVRIVEE